MPTFAMTCYVEVFGNNGFFLIYLKCVLLFMRCILLAIFEILWFFSKKEKKKDLAQNLKMKPKISCLVLFCASCPWLQTLWWSKSKSQLTKFMSSGIHVYVVTKFARPRRCSFSCYALHYAQLCYVYRVFSQLYCNTFSILVLLYVYMQHTKLQGAGVARSNSTSIALKSNKPIKLA